MPHIAIRLATPDDAAAVTAVFHTAIHGKASRSYDTEQLAAWSAGRTVEQFRRELELGLNPFLVAEVLADAPLAPLPGDAPVGSPGAETCGAREAAPTTSAPPSPAPLPTTAQPVPPVQSARFVVGFGALRGDEVAYLYAAPQAPPGTGSALLRELERRAVEQGWPELRLTASINALNFYKEHGYRELRRDIRVMSVEGGFVRLVAIEARKRLATQNAPAATGGVPPAQDADEATRAE